jgi:hypothetical protein
VFLPAPAEAESLLTVSPTLDIPNHQYIKQASLDTPLGRFHT